MMAGHWRCWCGRKATHYVISGAVDRCLVVCRSCLAVLLLDLWAPPRRADDGQA